MGTPAAVLWAIIYFWWHEKLILLPKYGDKMPLMLRYIDDAFAVILFGGSDGFTSEDWVDFKADMNN